MVQLKGEKNLFETFTTDHCIPLYVNSSYEFKPLIGGDELFPMDLFTLDLTRQNLAFISKEASELSNQADSLSSNIPDIPERLLINEDNPKRIDAFRAFNAINVYKSANDIFSKATQVANFSCNAYIEGSVLLSGGACPRTCENPEPLCTTNQRPPECSCDPNSVRSVLHEGRCISLAECPDVDPVETSIKEAERRIKILESIGAGILRMVSL